MNRFCTPRLLFAISIVALATSTRLGAQTQAAQVQTSIQHDVSIPLRDMVPVIAYGRHEEDDLPRIPRPNAVNLPDRAIQKSTSRLQGLQAPTTGVNFLGLGVGFPGVSVNVEPPDTNMAVGPTQIVQTVNTEFAVLDKTGHTLLTPRAIATLWSGFGGGCQANNDGDPIVLYDKFADRWFIEQFSVNTTPYLECVAVSTTNDATGSYYRYSFNYGSTQFNDYPKSGVWSDGYYTTYNIFNNGQTFAGSKVCAFDRSRMLLGQAATQQCFQTSASYGGLLTADIDGFNLPPNGTPNYVVGLDTTNTSLAFWTFHVDWTTPANSTFVGPSHIPIASYSTLCLSRSCIAQPGASSSEKLDGIDDRTMYRLAYRNYGAYDALYANHTVQAGSSTGVRWYEIRNMSTTPSVFQQGTFAPDTNFRWMGSIASDQQGNLALGYSHSGTSAPNYPGIRVTGRLAGDPLGTMQPETTLFTGSGSQLDSFNRWGDYSSMSVDPSDDCTFWFTTEYYATNGSFGWSTRIGSFKFPTCSSNPTPDLAIAKSHTGNFTQGQSGAQYTITVSNVGSADTSGAVTVTDTLPTGLTATAISGTGWTCTTSPLSCTRSDVLTASSSYPAITVTVDVASNAPASVTNTATVGGGGETNTSNDTATDVTNIAGNGTPDLAITKLHSGNFTQSQTGAQYTITVSNVGTGATAGTVSVTDTLPTGLTASSISGTGWSCTVSPLSCSRSDSLMNGASYPAITVTVNVASNAPSSVTNTATVSGGGETNTANDTATDPTTINVSGGTADMAITGTHTGNFFQGQVGATYTITVSNVGTGATTGKSYVADTLPTGLTATAISGTGWTCTLSSKSCSRTDVLAPSASYPPITLTVNVASTAPASVTNLATVSYTGDPVSTNNSSRDVTTITSGSGPDLTVTKSHTGNFTQGQTGATYTVTVHNGGTSSTTGTVTATDTLPTGLVATALSGTGWTCTLSPLSCNRSDALAAGSSYPAITVTVDVASNAPSSVTNSVTVSGGGETNTSNDTASDPTTISVPSLPDLTVTKSHAGNFTQGQSGASYTVVVKNSGTAPTAGVVTVTDALPAGLTATAISGTGWTCTVSPLSCNRSDALAAGSSYPAVTITVSVASNAGPTLTNTATVSGGGEVNTSNDTATDPTTITSGSGGPDLTITKTHTGNFTVSVNGTYTVTVTNIGSSATSGTVTVTDTLPYRMFIRAISGSGWTCTTSGVCSRSDALAPGSSYPPITITARTDQTGTQVNTVTVSGGGDTNSANNSASDPTIVQ